MEPIFLMAIMLNALNGQEIKRDVISGPYDTIQACETVQKDTGFQHPKIEAGVLTITVPECSVSHVDKAS